MSERLTLREFQEQLTDKLLLAELQSMPASRLAVEIGVKRWLVDLAEINEVMPVPRLLPVPMTRPWFVGMANIRGMLYGCSDLAAFFGLPATPLEGAARLLLVKPHFGVNAALVVSKTLGLRNPADLRPHGATPDACVRSMWLDGNEQAWRELDVAGLLEQADFLEIGE
jgi:twitching motility protein PilI